MHPVGNKYYGGEIDTMSISGAAEAMDGESAPTAYIRFPTAWCIEAFSLCPDSLHGD
jgi:hypothetical protein